MFCAQLLDYISQTDKQKRKQTNKKPADLNIFLYTYDVNDDSSVRGYFTLKITPTDVALLRSS